MAIATRSGDMFERDILQRHAKAVCDAVAQEIDALRMSQNFEPAAPERRHRRRWGKGCVKRVGAFVCRLVAGRVGTGWHGGIRIWLAPTDRETLRVVAVHHLEHVPGL